MNTCSWCKKTDEHYDRDESNESNDPNENFESEEFCNSCSFCEASICCVCWDLDDTCYYPGEGYCPQCRERLHSCPDCVMYMSGLMKEPSQPICEKHWN